MNSNKLILKFMHIADEIAQPTEYAEERTLPKF